MPRWYITIRAARYLKVAPWELENQPSYWRDRAIAAEKADNLIEKASIEQAQKESKRKQRNSRSAMS